MIIRTLLLFLVLFTSYNVYLHVFNPNVDFYQNQWQKNTKQAQEYVYYGGARNVIVGSSMSERMGSLSFAEDYYNLSFSAGSALTGLEIIKRSGIFPVAIYIEANTVFKAPDREMITTLFHPLLGRLRKYIPALQVKNQPLNIIFSKVKKKFGQSHKQLVEVERNEEEYSRRINRYVELYKKDLENFDVELERLIELVSFFESEGVKLQFFEMPVAKELQDLQRSVHQRAVIKKYFSSKRLVIPDTEQYLTTDGIHLTFASARKYSHKFVEYAR